MPTDTQAPTPLEIKPSRAMIAGSVGVIAVAAFLTLYLSFLLFGGGADMFAQRTTLTTYMPDGTGLSSESEVRLSGIRIGMVDKVEFSGLLDPQRAIRVRFHIWKRYLKNIPEDSQTDIDSDNIVGYAFIGVAGGKSPVPIGEDGVLQSEPLKQAVDRADEIKVLRDNLTHIDQLLAQASSPDTKIGNFIVSTVAYDQFHSTLDNAQRTIHTLITPQSTLGQAFYSLDMYNKIHDGVVNIDATLQSIQNGQGTAGQFYAKDDQYNDMLRQLSDLRTSLADTNSGKSSVPMLQNDDMYRSVQHALASIDSTLASLNAGEGRVGGLLANQQLYESLNGSVRELERVLRDLRENPRKYMRIKVR
jgi:phospholipid/cholesterol/gamma-HCH transport system substrate-binding protein